jgi:hypothetical protein
MWNAKAHEAKKMFLGVKHYIVKSGRKCKGLNPMTPKCTPTLGVALVWNFEYSKHWLKVSTNLNP